MTQPDLFSAMEARDSAIAKHSLKETGREWIDRAREAARRISKAKGYVTANMVRDAIGDPPAEADGRIMGAVFAAKEFICVGYERSNRAICNGRPIGRFEYVEAA